MYGLDPGHRVTATGQAAETTTIEPPASASWRTRVSSFGGPANRYAPASAGTTIQPSSIFVMKARPTTAPHHTRYRVRPVSIARTTRYAETISRRISSASGLLTRPTATITGVTASAAPAIRPATGPKTRRTVALSTATEPTVNSACGSSIAKDDHPNTRADSPIAHSESGGLSTVMNEPGSMAPKNHAFQL